MKSASVRELKNKTSEILRQAAREDVLITSRGRPVACLVGVVDNSVPIPSKVVRRDVLSQREKEKMFRMAGRIWKIKPDKGKKWIAGGRHDQVLYGNPAT